MAAKFPEDRQIKLTPRKGHDMTWSCDIHGEPISFYCKEHNTPICHKCATKDHQKPCQLDDIGDVILEKQGKLEDKLLEIGEAKTRLKKLDSKIKSCATFVIDHFKTLEDKVNTKYEAKIKSVKDKEQDEIRSINEKADEEIRIINEKRDKLIAACSLEAGKQHLPIKETQAKLTSDSEIIKRACDKRVDDLQSKNKYEADTLDNMNCKVKCIKHNDKTLVNEAAQIIASLDESLSDGVHQEMVDCIDQIQREVQKVKMVEGTVGGERYARIDGYIGKWELDKSIDIPSIFTVLGLVSNDDVMLTSNVKDVYVTNISSKHTEKAADTYALNNIKSCAPVDNNRIACGRCHFMSFSFGGCITLVDRQWKVVREIMIPRKASQGSAYAHVDVDSDGMILAADSVGSNIYIIDPADGNIVNTITMQGMMVHGGIQALSSGDIFLQTGVVRGQTFDDSEFTSEFSVITRSGEKKAAIQCDEWASPQCRVDKLTDTLYIAYWDAKRGNYAVDQVSCDGTIEAKRIVEYVKSDRGSGRHPCVITPSGNLVACNGDKLLVYKKTFTV